MASVVVVGPVVEPSMLVVIMVNHSTELVNYFVCLTDLLTSIETH